MKRIFKRLAAMALAITLATTLTPVNAFAAKRSSCGKMLRSSSGSVYTVMYPGAKPKKAKYTIEYNLISDSSLDEREDFIENKQYEVTITINRTYLTKSEIINIDKELIRKKASSINDFTPLIVDSDGDRAINLSITGGFDKDLSSPQKKQIAKTVKKTKNRKKTTTYSFYWRKVSVYKYRLMIPADHESVYVGVAGLRNGILRNSVRKDFLNNRINFYEAGYGSKREGYAYVSRIHKQSK